MQLEKETSYDFAVYGGKFKYVYITKDFVFKYLREPTDKKVYFKYYDLIKYGVSKGWRIADCYGVSHEFGVLGVKCERIDGITDHSSNIKYLPQFFLDKGREFVDWYFETLHLLSGEDKDIFIYLHKDVHPRYENNKPLLQYYNCGIKNNKIFTIDISIIKEEYDWHIKNPPRI